MLKTMYTILSGLFLAAPVFFAQETQRDYPTAFPERRPHAVRESAPSLPASVAVPPGMSTSALPSFQTPQPPPESADWLLRRMAESENPAARRRASEAWPVSDEVMRDLNALVYALADPDPGVRDGAVGRIRAIAPAEVFGFTMRVMVAGDAEQVRALESALPLLSDLLEPFMLETLRTEIETSQHRRIAAFCLGRMGAHRAIDALAEHAWNEDALISRASVDALYAIASPAAETHWMKLLEHAELYFRVQAVRALAVIGSPSAFARLRQIILSEGEETVQSEALAMIADYPGEQLLPLLVEILEINAPLRTRALQLLRARSGLELGARPSDWRAWVNAFLAGPPPSPIMPAP